VANSDTPYWVLISVLFSSFPLEEGLAKALHRVAFDLYSSGRRGAVVDHALAHGEVQHLESDAAVGSITGPVFEASLETPRGKGTVRFILTRQGLELMQAQAPEAKPRYLN
jgi:hypothetical protein